MIENEEVLDIHELGQLIKRTPRTITTDLVRHPERVPPYFKLPGARKPLWLKRTVNAFLRSHAELAGAAADDATPRDVTRASKRE